MKQLGWAELKRRELEGQRKDALVFFLAVGLAAAIWLGMMWHYGIL